MLQKNYNKIFLKNLCIFTLEYYAHIAFFHSSLTQLCYNNKI